jgi:lipopolysaccharide export system permease protein
LIRILDKYILKELLGNFIFGVVIFTTILIAGSILFKLVKLMVEQNIDFFVATKLFIYSLPRLIIFSLPMSVLLSCLVSFSRLSSDNEITAMKAGGISFYNISLTPLLFSLFVYLTSIILNESVVPASQRLYTLTLLQEVKKEKNPLTTKNIFLKEMESDKIRRILYANEFDGKSSIFKKVVDLEFKNGFHIHTIIAEEAKLEKGVWYFKNGKLYNFEKKENIQIVYFKEQKIFTDKTTQDILREQKTPEQMKISELRQEIQILKKEYQDINPLLIELYSRFSLPFSSFIFALLGISLGIKPHRSGSSIGVGLSSIIIFIYYVITTVFNTWGKAGILPPILGAWIPNLLFFLLGIFLLKKVAT